MNFPEHDIGSFLSPLPYNPYFIQTEFSIIQSEIVLGNVITNLHLNEVWGKKYNNGTSLNIYETIHSMKQRMELKPERNSKLVVISFFDENPKEAADVANAIVIAYEAQRQKTRKENAIKAIHVLEEQYQQQEEQIRVVQTNLDVWREKLKIPSNASPPSLNMSDTTFTAASMSQIEVEQPYWQAKQWSKTRIELQKLLKTKIDDEKNDLMLPHTTTVSIIDSAQPPKFPATPNRYLGAALLLAGLISAGLGFSLLKPAPQKP